MIKSVCVFCGSATGARPDYAEAAAKLGRTLAERGLTMVFGGGHVGLMGIAANAALSAGGTVIGVIPQALMEWEVGHQSLTELRVVGSMHERKAMMADLSDAFIALPGGIGTLEELFEIWTWGQLGFHAKPLGLLDVAGYFKPLSTFIGTMVAEGFLKDRHRAMVGLETEPHRLLERLNSYSPPDIVKVVGRNTI